MHLLAYNLIRTVMAEAAARRSLRPRRQLTPSKPGPQNSLD